MFSAEEKREAGSQSGPPASLWQEVATLLGGHWPGRRPGGLEQRDQASPLSEGQEPPYSSAVSSGIGAWGGDAAPLSLCYAFLAPQPVPWAQSGLRGPPGGLGIHSVSWGAVGSQRSQPVTSGSSSRPVAGS